MTELMRRRRALMAMQGKNKNKLSYAYGNGNSIMSLNADQTISLAKFASGYDNRLSIVPVDPISVAVGDVVKIKFTRISGTAPSATFVYGYIGPASKTVYNNVQFATAVIGQTVTYTVDTAADYTWIYFRSSSADKTISPALVFRLTIWVNDKIVLGEA